MKRSLGYAAATGLLALAGIRLALRLSPWPGALLIKQLFNRGDVQTSALLDKHVPDGVLERPGLAYGRHPDEQLDLYLPAHAQRPLPLLAWVHGGGWVAGSRQAVANWLRIVAAQGYACAAIGYSTASVQARYPTPLRQVQQALDWLDGQAAALGLDADRVVLGGSSAGAQISAQVALMGSSASYARRIGLPVAPLATRLRGTVLLSGAFDIAGVGDNWLVNSLLWAYTGKRDFRRDAWLHLMAIPPNLSGRYPPSFITSGNADPLLPQALALARRMQALGMDTDTLFFADDHPRRLLHEYQFNLDTAEGQLSQQRLYAFLQRVTAVDDLDTARQPQVLAG